MEFINRTKMVSTKFIPNVNGVLADLFKNSALDVLGLLSTLDSRMSCPKYEMSFPILHQS